MKECKVKKQLIYLTLFLVANCSTLIAHADNGFERWKSSFRQSALAEGIQAKVFDQALANIIIDPQVIKSDGSQPEFTRNVWDYLNNVTSNARIKKGKALLQEHRDLLNIIEKRYGVQREIIVAIWAMESDFGRNYGNQNVLRSLATLAYASSSEKRRAFAQNELLITLKIIQTKKVQSENLVGSWAGAMGQPQFMPSSYIKFGVDYNQDSKIDLWGSIPDIFASIANFLAESGWRKNESWGEEVKLPKRFDWRLNGSTYQLRFEQWQQSAVTKFDGSRFDFPQRQASLFIPAGKQGPAFLITHNFSVIKRYNQSSSYALGVVQLSDLFGSKDKIRGAWPIQDKALSVIQVKEIQRLLNLSGHDVGDVDGKIGSKTREAIRTWQLENGFAGDGYANLELLGELKANLR